MYIDVSHLSGYLYVCVWERVLCICVFVVGGEKVCPDENTTNVYVWECSVCVCVRVLCICVFVLGGERVCCILIWFDAVCVCVCVCGDMCICNIIWRAAIWRVSLFVCACACVCVCVCPYVCMYISTIWMHMYIYCIHMHCNTLQHAATCCSTLQHTATHCNIFVYRENSYGYVIAYVLAYIYTATHCNTSKREQNKEMILTFLIYVYTHRPARKSCRNWALWKNEKTQFWSSWRRRKKITTGTNCSRLRASARIKAQVCCVAVLQCVALRCSMLQCVAVACGALQCVAVCCNCSRLRVSARNNAQDSSCSVFQCVSACCSMVQCVAVYCSVWQPLRRGASERNNAQSCRLAVCCSLL